MKYEVGSILLFQKVIPSYRLSLFRKLYEQFGIVVCHSIERNNATWKSFHANMDFPNEIMMRFYFGKSDTNVAQNIIPPLLKYRPRVVIAEFSLGYFTFWLLYLLRPILGYRLVVWTHGIKNKDILHPFSDRKGQIELYILRHADAVLLYSHYRKKIIETTLIESQKLFVALNTLDTPQFLRLHQELDTVGRPIVKKKLGITAKFNLIYIGRLLKEKRIDLLFESFFLLESSFDVNLHIIGDGPMRSLVDEALAKSSAVVYHGPIYSEEVIARYIYAADLMVCPTNVGLSIVHSFAYGTPFVTCGTTDNGPFHGPEIEYLHHGQNGFLCELSAQSLAKKISHVLKDEALLRKMSAAALKTVSEECPLDKMISGFEDLLEYVH